MKAEKGEEKQFVSVRQWEEKNYSSIILSCQLVVLEKQYYI